MATARKAKKATTSPRKRKPAEPAAPDLAAAFRENYVPPPAAVANPVITLDADVAPHFRDARAVNEALRALLRIVRQVRVA